MKFQYDTRNEVEKIQKVYGGGEQRECKKSIFCGFPILVATLELRIFHH